MQGQKNACMNVSIHAGYAEETGTDTIWRGRICTDRSNLNYRLCQRVLKLITDSVITVLPFR